MTKVYTVCCDMFGCQWQASSETPQEIGTWLAEHSEHGLFSIYVEDE